MTNEQQPEALRLAKILEDHYFYSDTNEAAAELRRLRAENDDFRATIDHLTRENAEQIGEIVALKEQRDDLLGALEYAEGLVMAARFAGNSPDSPRRHRQGRRCCMNTDRELLELAAKAAGIKIRWQSYGNYFVICDIDDGGIEAVWNPILDDGDALRLAVKLGIIIDTGDGVHVQYVIDCIAWPISELDFTDIYAATRRAIVRAAAEIGRNMK